MIARSLLKYNQKYIYLLKSYMVGYQVLGKIELADLKFIIITKRDN